jgi:hypothetical protein
MGFLNVRDDVEEERHQEIDQVFDERWSEGTVGRTFPGLLGDISSVSPHERSLFVHTQVVD